MLDIHALPSEGYYNNNNLTDLSRLWINCAFLLNSNMCLRAQVGTKCFSHSFLNHPRDNCLLHVYAYSTCNPDECMQTVIRHEGFLRLSWVWVVWNAFGLVFCLSSFMYFIREPKIWSQAKMFVSVFETVAGECWCGNFCLKEVIFINVFLTFL